MKHIFAFVFLLVLNTKSYSQETVVFQTKKSEPKSKSDNSSNKTNIVKIAPLSFISGFVPVYYERNINDFISLQVGAGVTTKNYIQDLIGDAGANDDGLFEKYKKVTWADGNTTGNYTIENPTYGGENRKTNIGYVVSLEPRLYFNNEAPDGGFIGLHLSQRRNNFTSKTVNSTSTSGNPTFGGSTKEYDNVSTLMVNFGNQALYDNLTIEYTAGIGIRKINGQHYIYGYGNNGKYVSGTGFIDRTRIAFDITFKIGYQLKK